MAEATYSTVPKPWSKLRAAMSRCSSVFGHRLAGLIVPGEAAQDVRLLEPVLVKLRRQFDEIGGDVGAGNGRIGDRREQPVQRVAELVEQSARVIEAEQRRLARRRLGEIADIDDQRTNVAGELFLFAQRGHPGAAALGRTRKIVAEEQADLAAVAAAHLPDAHVGMPDRDVGALREAQPEQALGGVEGGFDHPLEIEVWLDRRLVDVAASLPQLLGVVAPVPGRQREIAAFLLHQALATRRGRPRARARARVHTVSSRPRTAAGVLAMASSSR